MRAAREDLENLLEAERAQLPPWVVVGLGSGIGAWFALDELNQWAAFLCIGAALTLAGLTLLSGRAGRALGWFALAATIGCALVWARSDWVAEPRLTHPVVADVAGRVETIDYLAAKGSVRLTVAPADHALPPHVRISIDEKNFPAGIAPRRGCSPSRTARAAAADGAAGYLRLRAGRVVPEAGRGRQGARDRRCDPSRAAARARARANRTSPAYFIAPPAQARRNRYRAGHRGPERGRLG